jgi:branched-chain amino acid transport system permease protein
VALLLGSVAAALVAVLLALPALRIRGLFLAVTTLAFAVVMSTFILDANRFPILLTARVPRPKLFFIDAEDERVFYFLALAGLFVAVFIAQGLRRTRTGRVLIGMRDNERAAQALGLSLVRTRLVTFAISGFLAAFAGVLYAAHNHTVRADAFGPEQSIDIFLMAVIGGLGSVSGVLTGAAYIGFVQLVIPGALGRLLASGVGVLLVLLFYPAGLGGAVFAVRDSFLRRVALRDKIYVPALLGDLG